jgi:hypothetical protein
VRGILRNRGLAIVAVALLIGLLAFEVATLTRDEGLPDATPAEIRLSRRFAEAVTSFDHKRIDADVARVLALGTPGFEREFRRAMGADFTQRVVANKTVSRGSVIAGPRPQSVADGRATLLVVVDQQVTSEGGQGTPQVIRVGLLVTVDQQASQVAKVEVL